MANIFESLKDTSSNLFFAMLGFQAITYSLGQDKKNFLSMYKYFVDSSPYPILITTLDFHIIYINRAWRQSTGYTTREALGRIPKFVLSRNISEEVYEKMLFTLEKGLSFTSENIIISRKNKKEYNARLVMFPILKKGKPIFYAQVHYDITERKRLEDQKTEFLTVAAHEMKTPLTTLKLLTAHNQKTVQNNNAQIKIEDLATFNREIDRITRIVNDIVDLQHFQTGRYTLYFSTIDIVAYVQQVAHKLQRIVKNPILLKSEIKKQMLSADGDRIDQVLTNLITNAARHSNPQKPIKISILKKGKCIIIKVRDYGEGILLSEQKHIFEPFYQGRYKRTGKFGLGLYIAKQIVLQHRGEIWVKSQRGKGSTFFFSLAIR